MQILRGEDLAEIQSIYDNHSASMPVNTHYRLAIDHVVLYPPLGGGLYFVEGFKISSELEWQVARSYNAIGIKTYVRSKYVNVWNDWVAK